MVAPGREERVANMMWCLSIFKSQGIIKMSFKDNGDLLDGVG
jgi:hypothetical protein